MGLAWAGTWGLPRPMCAIRGRLKSFTHLRTEGEGAVQLERRPFTGMTRPTWSTVACALGGRIAKKSPTEAFYANDLCLKPLLDAAKISCPRRCRRLQLTRPLT